MNNCNSYIERKGRYLFFTNKRKKLNLNSYKILTIFDLLYFVWFGGICVWGYATQLDIFENAV